MVPALQSAETLLSVRFHCLAASFTEIVVVKRKHLLFNQNNFILKFFRNNVMYYGIMYLELKMIFVHYANRTKEQNVLY